MRVNIFYEDHMGTNDYYGAGIELPAGKHSLQDALERAHVPAGESHNIRIEYITGRVEDAERFLFFENSPFTLDEINLLAFKLEQMDAEQLLTFEMAVEHLYLSGDNKMPYPKDIINLFYNLEQFRAFPGIMDDEDLGEVCLSGGIMEQIDQLDMEIFDLLDPKKVGAMQRVNEQGFFTESGYVIKDSEHWQDVYDGMTLPEPVIVADSIVNAIFRRKTKEADMEIINCLEERLTMLNKDELCKYKAVLRFERCRDFEAALCLADQLDDYDFEPDCMTAF